MNNTMTIDSIIKKQQRLEAQITAWTEALYRSNECLKQAITTEDIKHLEHWNKYYKHQLALANATYNEFLKPFKSQINFL